MALSKRASRGSTGLNPFLLHSITHVRFDEAVESPSFSSIPPPSSTTPSSKATWVPWQWLTGPSALTSTASCRAISRPMHPRLACQRVEWLVPLSLSSGRLHPGAECDSHRELGASGRHLRTSRLQLGGGPCHDPPIYDLATYAGCHRPLTAAVLPLPAPPVAPALGGVCHLHRGALE